MDVSVNVAFGAQTLTSVFHSGCLALSFYMIKNHTEAPPPSIGFPSYIYPDDATCAMYEGVPCEQDTSLCCFNVAKWCDENGENCQADVRCFD